MLSSLVVGVAVGTTDGSALAAEIAGAGEEGIHLVTVGYGMGNYNDTLMEQLANQGDGFYAYLDTFEEAEQLFVEDLTQTLTVVARDAKSLRRIHVARIDFHRQRRRPARQRADLVRGGRRKRAGNQREEEDRRHVSLAIATWQGSRPHVAKEEP